MQFDIVIGNPPYNNDIYLDFVTLGYRLSKRFCCMITPAKWQAKTDGKPRESRTPDKNEIFRKYIVPHMTKIAVYKDTRDIFDIGESGGISYYLIDKQKYIGNSNEYQVKAICARNKNFETTDFEIHTENELVLYPNRIVSLIQKVLAQADCYDTLDNTLILKRQVFVGEQERGESSISQDKIKGKDYVEIMQGEKVVGYKQINELLTQENIEKYKCVQSCMPAQGGHSPFRKEDGLALGSNLVIILKPYQVPKGSYQVLRYFDTFEEASNFKNYINSKMMSMMQLLGVCGTIVSREFYRFIPDQQDWETVYEDKPKDGFLPNEHGIYIDESGVKHCSLYEKYGLTQEEIEIIESTIAIRKEK